uniref:ADAM metallopeptidase domain 28 n=1 Tax=Paramormyrops kingsleyae TaxID=1676925 RepID=A0A3B3R2F9_9TELE|nr:disintegrin and metalloproteinase domain-containing protein 28 [Paramormyrops kingsleyae]
MIPTSWIVLLLVLCDASESLHPEPEGLKDHVIIRPVKLHALHKRSTRSSRPDVLKYGMQVNGQDVVLHLEKNEDLLTKGYSETTYSENGAPITVTPKDLDHCYYHGRIVNDTESIASISTCDGLRGYIRTAAQQYLIEPMSGADDGDHALARYEALNEDPVVCGVTNSSWDPVYPPSTGKARSRSSGPSLLQQQKYVDLLLVADNREYKKMNSNENELRKRIFEIVNYVNLVYKPLKTFIALTGLEVWTDQDNIAVTPPAGATLDAFTNWRKTSLVKQHDNAHLLTGIDFEGSTVGLAYVGSFCATHSTGVIQDHSSSSIAVGATLAHEMGHNLGMSHDSDSCICTDKSCIMSAALSYNIPKHFSSCSSNSYGEYLDSRNPQCLFNKPDYNAIISPPVCGNGFVEKGEECDCGTVEECNNPCCNATTCTLTAGSQCEEGECCENCKLMPPSRMCRSQKDECDLAEYCTGKSKDCPEDVFSVNGIPCKNGQGYCYNGQCPMRESQCIKIWGSNAQLAADSCYNQNTRGVYYGFCTRPSKDTYIGCQKKDVKCGKLFCINGKDTPNYNRLVSFPGCKAIFSDDPNTDFGQVDTGTKCSDGLVCMNNECVDLEAAYRATNCSARCKGNAVCNHRRECQCQPGWQPPDCDRMAEGFQKLAPGVIIAITVVISLLIIIAIIVVLLYVLKRKRKSSIPHRPARYREEMDSGVNNPAFSQRSTPNFQVKVPKPTVAPPIPPPPVSFKPGSQAIKSAATRQVPKPTVAPPIPPPPVSLQPGSQVINLAAARKALKPPQV